MPKANCQTTTRGAFAQPLPTDINGLAAAFDSLHGATKAFIAVDNQRVVGDTAVLIEWLDELFKLKEAVARQMEKMKPANRTEVRRKYRVLARQALDCA